MDGQTVMGHDVHADLEGTGQVADGRDRKDCVGVVTSYPRFDLTHVQTETTVFQDNAV